MSSFGEGIQVTPLQLAALSAAFANGGTLYYLQYPHTQEEVENITPRVKRELNISAILPEIREGLLAAVLYGTGKSSFDRDGDALTYRWRLDGRALSGRGTRVSARLRRRGMHRLSVAVSDGFGGTTRASASIKAR